PRHRRGWEQHTAERHRQLPVQLDRYRRYERDEPNVVDGEIQRDSGFEYGVRALRTELGTRNVRVSRGSSERGSLFVCLYRIDAGAPTGVIWPDVTSRSATAGVGSKTSIW